MDTALIFGAAFLAGVLNAIAGGGSFLTFPALVFTGVPPIIANASSTVAVSPGSFASAWGYRNDFVPFEKIGLWPMLAISLVGGTLGALLLLWTPAHTFDRVVPWLLLGATLLFGFGRQLTPLLLRWFTIGPAALVAIQFLIAIYGGYFGGAIGILMLALYGLFGLEDLTAMNAVKTLLAGTMNGAAVVCFIFAGKVWWPQTLVMLVAAVLGGYAGARVGRHIDPTWLRIGVTIVGLAMSAAFFLRA
ncbi:MAG: sulfite exporter TauE/SafE family protein [Aliidongia sp.]